MADEMTAVVAAARIVAGLVNAGGGNVRVIPPVVRLGFSVPVAGGAVGGYGRPKMIRQHVPVLPEKKVLDSPADPSDT
jgi:hypothetical protein